MTQKKIDQERISRILGSEMEPVSGDMVQQVLQHKGRREGQTMTPERITEIESRLKLADKESRMGPLAATCRLIVCDVPDLIAALRECEAERARYKAALEQMVRDPYAHTAKELRDIATEALAAAPAVGE